MGGADHAALLEKSRQIAEAAFDVSFGPFSEDNGHSARSRVFDRFERGRAPAEMAPQCAGDEVGEGGDFEQAVLVQALDLLGAHRDRRIAPAEADVGMMSLRLGELRRAADKRKGLAEVREPVGPLDRVVSSRSAHSGAWARYPSASSGVSGGMPPRHGVQVFSASLAIIMYPPWTAGFWQPGTKSPDDRKHQCDHPRDP